MLEEILDELIGWIESGGLIFALAFGARLAWHLLKRGAAVVSLIAGGAMLTQAIAQTSSKASLGETLADIASASICDAAEVMATADDED